MEVHGQLASLSVAKSGRAEFTCCVLLTGQTKCRPSCWRTVLALKQRRRNDWLLGSPVHCCHRRHCASFLGSSEHWLTDSFLWASACLVGQRWPPPWFTLPIIRPLSCLHLKTYPLIFIAVSYLWNLVRSIHRFAGFLFFVHAIGPAHTTLELVACVMITLRFTLDVAGLLKYEDDPGPAAVALCLLVDSPSLITLGLDGGITSVVVITLDRYWRIVHSVHYRKYYRRWMLYVGLFLPWLNGIAVHLLPSIGITRIVNGRCVATSFWPSASMNKVWWHVKITAHLKLMEAGSI